MSHGPSGSAIKAEPNLTPLLDVVLQLLMFFMMCVNFVSEQVNEHIQLPVAQSARPMDKREGEVLYLNLNRQGGLEVVGKDTMTNPAAWRLYLMDAYRDAERLD